MAKIGALAQNQGDYWASSKTLLEQAERLSDTFFQENFSNRSWAYEQTQDKATHRGKRQWNAIYISYLKIHVNSPALAEQEQNTAKKTPNCNDAARGEVRRIDYQNLKKSRTKSQLCKTQRQRKPSPFLHESIELGYGILTTSGDETQTISSIREMTRGRVNMEGLQYELIAKIRHARLA